MDNSKTKQFENLAVNNMGKKIKKTPLHHLNYGIRSYEPEPIVYNVSKENFKSFVQLHTGSPNHPPHKPPNNTPKPTITRLQTIRPPPLSLVRPTVSVPAQVSFAIPAPVQPSFLVPISSAPKSPPPHVKIFDFPRLPDGLKETSSKSSFHPSIVAPQPSTISLPWDKSSANMVESPMSVYVKSLLEDSDLNGDQFQPEPNDIPFPPSSPTDFVDIPFLSPQSPYGPLFPPNIHLPSPPSSPLFPPEFQFPSPQSPYGPQLPPDIPPPFSPSVLFPMSPSGIFPISPSTLGQI